MATKKVVILGEDDIKKTLEKYGKISKRTETYRVYL
jgi:hypothetical protein